MRFGLHLPQFGTQVSAEAVRRFAEAAEELGFDSLWASDHVVVPAAARPYLGETFWDPFTLLAYAAAVTSRPRLGTSVIIAPYREPLGVAKMVATLDNLSGGRVICGVGAGWLEAEFEALGVPFAERGARTDEYLAIYRLAWAEKDPRFAGRFRRFAGVSLEPRPLQRPHPPLWIGGHGAAALGRAAELGDAWHPVRASPEEVRAGTERLRRLSRAHGRQAPGVSVRCPAWLLAGREEGDPRTLVGPPGWVVEQVARYAAAGADHLLLDFFLTVPGAAERGAGELVDMARRFAREVVARSRGRGARSGRGGGCNFACRW